jgi:hypothetical protein
MNKTKLGLTGLLMLLPLASCEEDRPIEKKEIEIKNPPSKYFLVPEPSVTFKASNSKTNQTFNYQPISEYQVRFRFTSESKNGLCADTITGIAKKFKIRPDRRNGGIPSGEEPWEDTFVATNGDCILYVETKGLMQLRVKSTGCKAKEQEECPLNSVMPMGKNGWKPMPDSLKIDRLPYL